MLAPARDLAAAQREHVHPFAGDRLAGLPHGERVVTEHEHLVVGRVKLARRELGELLVLGDQLEELLHVGCADTRPEGRIIGLATDRLPVDLGCKVGDDRRHVAAPECAIKALNGRNIGTAHEALPLACPALREVRRSGFMTLIGKFGRQTGFRFYRTCCMRLAAQAGATARPGPESWGST
jgi:hypothetical protein